MAVKIEESALEKATRLRAEAHQLEQSAQAQARTALVAEADEKLRGRAFVRQWRSHKAEHLAARRYVKFELIHGDPHFLADCVCVSSSYVGSKRGASVEAHRMAYPQQFSSMFDVGEPEQVPMDLAVFNRLYDAARTFSDVAMGRLLDATGLQPVLSSEMVLENRMLDDEAELDIDIPWILLTPPETTVVPKRYLLPGYRYVVTPGSIQAALNNMVSDTRRLGACMPLLQECDMASVDSEMRIRTHLRRKLAEACDKFGIDCS